MAKFRLATLLKLRERERDQAAKAVQDARMAIDKLTTQKQELLAENETMNSIRKSASQGAMNLQSILDTQRFQMVLGAQVQQIDNHLGTLHQELQRREALLLKCQQGVKSLEKLRDQREESEEVLALQKQQERTDEWASVRFAMDIQSQSDDS